MLQVNRRPLLVRHLREWYFTLTRPLQVLYWYLFRPSRPGAKTFVFHGERLLLVRLGYAHKRWVLPGGGIDRGEEPEAAAKREVFEESGLRLEKLTYIDQRHHTNQYRKVTVFYYTAAAATENLVIDGQEIVDAGWFPLSELPEALSPRLREEITMYTTWKYGTQNS